MKKTNTQVIPKDRVNVALSKKEILYLRQLLETECEKADCPTIRCCAGCIKNHMLTYLNCALQELETNE